MIVSRLLNPLLRGESMTMGAACAALNTDFRALLYASSTCSVKCSSLMCS